MAGLRGWIASEWRRSWRSLTLLALLVAFGGAITIGAVGGARRADSDLDHFLDLTSAPLVVSPRGESEDLGVYDGADSIAADMAAIDGVEGGGPAAGRAGG